MVFAWVWFSHSSSVQSVQPDWLSVSFGCNCPSKPLKEITNLMALAAQQGHNYAAFFEKHWNVLWTKDSAIMLAEICNVSDCHGNNTSEGYTWDLRFVMSLSSLEQTNQNKQGKSDGIYGWPNTSTSKQDPNYVYLITYIHTYAYLPMHLWMYVCRR